MFWRELSPTVIAVSARTSLAILRLNLRPRRMRRSGCPALLFLSALTKSSGSPLKYCTYCACFSTESTDKIISLTVWRQKTANCRSRVISRLSSNCCFRRLGTSVELEQEIYTTAYGFQNMLYIISGGTILQYGKMAFLIQLQNLGEDL